MPMHRRMKADKRIAKPTTCFFGCFSFCSPAMEEHLRTLASRQVARVALVRVALPVIVEDQSISVNGSSTDLVPFKRDFRFRPVNRH